MRKIYNTIKIYSVTGIMAVAVLSSCKKDRKRTAVIDNTKGIYVLTEGAFGQNNGDISFYDVASKTTTLEKFKEVNGRALGESPNDLQIYGSKMYVAVSGNGNNNSSIEVIDVATCRSLKHFEMGNAQPRYVAFANGKAFVSNYDGTISRIDTATYAKDELQLKNNNADAKYLGGLAVANNKLYVAGSSYYLTANTFNDKVVVVDLATFTQSKNILVNYNPGRIVANGNGEVIVDCDGKIEYPAPNYIKTVVIAPAVQKINTTTDAVTLTEVSDVFALTAGNGLAWAISGTPKAFSLATLKLGSSLITDNTTIQTPYALTINGLDNSVLVSDAKGYASKGQAVLFSATGTKLFSFEAGQNPQKAVFTYNYRYE